MDILKILQESSNDLIPEDLEFFETELATGGPYDEVYQTQCMNKIKQLKKWMAGETSSKDDVSDNREIITTVDKQEQPTGHEDKLEEKKNKSIETKGILIGVGNVLPKGVNIDKTKFTKVDLIKSDMKVLRDRDDYKSKFKKYIKESDIVDSNFLDKNFSLFDSWEMNTIVSIKQLGEEFLEKYFAVLDHEKIARDQFFSESFFMKHFAQMKTSIVLKHGKNEWRKKEKRSKQLDVFLRLKGVKI